MKYRRLKNSSAGLVKKAYDLEKLRWGRLAGEWDNFRKRPENGVFFVAYEDGQVYGEVSALTLPSIADSSLLSSWNTLTGKGTLSTSGGGEILVLVSISVRPHGHEKSVKRQEDRPPLSLEALEKYLASGQDSVMNFHRKPKGGQEKGAEVVQVIRNGRPADKEALGVIVLMKYPALKSKPTFSETKSVGVHLIEAVMQWAYDEGIKDIYAYSRPADLSKYFTL